MRLEGMGNANKGGGEYTGGVTKDIQSGKLAAVVDIGMGMDIRK